MISDDIGLVELLAHFGIKPDSPLPTLIAGRNLLMGKRRRLEELVLRVEGSSGLTDLRKLIAELYYAIRKKSTGSEYLIIYYTHTYTPNDTDMVFLNHKGEFRLVPLTYTERAILKYLMEHPGENLELRSIADRADVTNPGYVPSHIANIRQKLGDSPKNPRYIETVRGVGYRFIVTVVKRDNATYNVPTPQ